MSQTTADRLISGQVGVMATDTVYGLVASAQNQTAVARLYSLKDRHAKPGTIIAASIDQLIQLGIKGRYLKAVQDYWPNPISVVVPSEPNLKYLDMGRMSLAVRIPKDKELQKLLQLTGPLVTTSANTPGQPPANNLLEARQYFGDKVDFYQDGGDLSDHQSSTVIRVVDDAVVVLRRGAVNISEETGEIINER